MLGVSAVYVTPCCCSIPRNTASLSAIYTHKNIFLKWNFYFFKCNFSKFFQKNITTIHSQFIKMFKIIMYNGITCGTHFGETKLVVSITGSPERDKRFMSSILTVVGTISCSQSTIPLTSNMHWYPSSNSVLTNINPDNLNGYLDKLSTNIPSTFIQCKKQITVSRTIFFKRAATVQHWGDGLVVPSGPGFDPHCNPHESPVVCGKASNENCFCLP